MGQHEVSGSYPFLFHTLPALKRNTVTYPCTHEVMVHNCSILYYKGLSIHYSLVNNTAFGSKWKPALSIFYADSRDQNTPD